MDVSFYKLGPGLQPFLRHGSVGQPDLNLQPGEGWIEGIFPDDQFAMLDGVPIAHVPAPTREEIIRRIKLEARSRIEDRGWTTAKQLNVMAEGGDALIAMRSSIDAFRAASNRLEAMDPIPLDYAHNRWWPA